MSKYNIDFVKQTILEMGIEPLFDEYFDTSQKLKVRCPIHGVFYKTFFNFLEAKKINTNGCQKCGIDKQRKGFDYALNLVRELGYIPLFKKYKNCIEPLLIKCPKHGEFYANLRALERVKNGNQKNLCNQCEKEYWLNKVKADIEKIGLISHFTEYKNNRERLLVECPKHGKFNITYSNVQILIKKNGVGNGCKKCDNERKTKLSLEEKLDKRKYPEYYIWRKNVFKRDNYICQKCGIKGETLNAHHIFNYSDNKELRTEITNGITLCSDCHNKFHQLYGIKHNNKKQIEEFICKEIEING